MAWRTFKNAANMSEFVSGRHGTCQELATLAALHVVRPDDYPMNAAALETILAWQRAHDPRIPADGTSYMSDAAAYLDSLGVRYSLHAPAELHDLLQRWAGLRPIIVEVTNGGALPGDEKNLHGHYICVLGGDVPHDSYLCADGDNYVVRHSGGVGPLAPYRWSDIQAAQPYAVLAVEENAMLTLTMPEVAQHFADASAGASERWRCTQTGAILRDGMLKYYRTMLSNSQLAGLYELGLPLTDEIPVPGLSLPAGAPVPTVQRFEMGSRLYDPDGRVSPRPGDTHENIYPAHVDTGIGRA
jgi:hypothetical protein